jgi:hypothetical protein
MTMITKGMGKILTNIFKPKMPKASKAIRKLPLKGVTDRNIYSGKDNVKKMFKDLAKKGVTEPGKIPGKILKTAKKEKKGVLIGVGSAAITDALLKKNNRDLKKASQKNKNGKK